MGNFFNAMNHPWLGKVNIPSIKMVMTGGLLLCYPHYKWTIYKPLKTIVINK